MDVDVIIPELEHLSGHFPRAAVEAAVAQREEITPHLLEALKDPGRLLRRLEHDDGYMLPVYAFYLLAQFREERAYPLIVDFFVLPRAADMDVTGDFVTESLGQVLASVCGGDVGPLRRLIEDPGVDEYVRSAAMQALLVMVAEGERPRDDVVAYFRTLFNSGLEREPSYAWDALVTASTHLYPEDLMPEIRQAFAEGYLDEQAIDQPYVEEVLARGKDTVLRDLSEDRHMHLIRDTAAELQWWACFQSDDPEPSSSILRLMPSPSQEPAPPTPLAPAPLPEKVGRNDPCPCGSGRKYKHCHGKR